MIIPVLLLAAGAVALTALVLTKDTERTVPDRPADLPQAPLGQTRWKALNAILPALKKAADASKIPLGLLVGWIARESGGKIAIHPQPGPGDTSLDERGYFQLMPDESKAIGFEHERLSVDPTYSINAGLALIAKYEGDVEHLGIATPGTSYFYRLVKLAHSMGTGALDKIIALAKTAGVTGSWAALEAWAIANDAQILHETKHSAKKWMPFVDDIYSIGLPFGFGSDAPAGTTTIVGAFDDIIDPLDVLQPPRAA